MTGRISYEDVQMAIRKLSQSTINSVTERLRSKSFNPKDFSFQGCESAVTITTNTGFSFRLFSFNDTFK